MTLRRTVRINSAGLSFVLPRICDQCQRPRNLGKHDKCSKARQALNKHRHEGSR